MKMKVIELLNLLAENKVKKGTRIRYFREIYIINFPNLCGIYPEGRTTKADNSLFTKLDICSLNYEVEIIEDEKEIQSIETLNPHDEYFRDGTELVYKLMYDKINEIAMKVNQLDKKVNSIGQK